MSSVDILLSIEASEGEQANAEDGSKPHLEPAQHDLDHF